MSQHNSFKQVGGSSMKKARNVLKRFERVAILQRRGQWKEQPGVKVTGLPKTKPDV